MLRRLAASLLIGAGLSLGGCTRCGFSGSKARAPAAAMPALALINGRGGRCRWWRRSVRRQRECVSELDFLPPRCVGRLSLRVATRRRTARRWAEGVGAASGRAVARGILAAACSFGRCSSSARWPSSRARQRPRPPRRRIIFFSRPKKLSRISVREARGRPGNVP